ncbi:hypothetical protein LTR70_004887 [Exophiala xenobiotica]|uniref:Uncharacterized protein n=1 Tax=Lithohypha guttulata TaxID=1690604 RepID=A0ABR0KBX2_9EURO|nr:hypothetical protein LTR24_004505 [Lithohypha guttulata]KAK5319842.1 hypothetical protein LTR70_004887 [Exophiala xenobiotica]
MAFDQLLEEDETRKPVLISIKKDLKSVLDELYATHATILDAEEWFDQNPFHEALSDTDTQQW